MYKRQLQYYVNMAKELEKRGAHILAIKDMSGLLKPYAAKKLIKTLKEEVGLPIHLHTHDTSGNQVAAYLMACLLYPSCRGVTGVYGLVKASALFQHVFNPLAVRRVGNAGDVVLFSHELFAFFSVQVFLRFIGPVIHKNHSLSENFDFNLRILYSDLTEGVTKI